MSLCRSVGLASLLARRSSPYAFVATGRLRSSKGGEAGVLEDKEKAAESVFVRKHEEELMERQRLERERKAKEEAKKQEQKK